MVYDLVGSRGYDRDAGCKHVEKGDSSEEYMNNSRRAKDSTNNSSCFGF